MADGNISVTIQITSVWVLGPAIVWHEAGKVAKLTVLGVNVYMRVGQLHWLCGITWRGERHAT